MPSVGSSVNAGRKDDADSLLELDLLGLPYLPLANLNGAIVGNRAANPVVFFDIQTMGGRILRDGKLTKPNLLGRLYFELRKDLVPVAASNFLALCSGVKGYSNDGIRYCYKDTQLHRVVKNVVIQGGDLANSRGECSRSCYEGRLFRDENFILRHTGPGCISYCNRGADSNGSIFQICLSNNPDLDGLHVVFGCLASDDSYNVLTKINQLGTDTGQPLEDIRVVDCGVAYSEE